MAQDPMTIDDLKELTRRLINVQATYIGNKFEDTQTQNMFQDMSTQINLLQRIVKGLIDNIPTL